MLSINPFLQTPRDHRIDSLNRVISVLLQGLALHSFSHDEAEFDVFQRALRKLREEISRVDDDDSALILAGSAIRILEEHRGAAERSVAARQNELEAAMALISDSLLQVGHVSEALTLELKESERDIAAARQPAELASARARLAKCLEEIRLRAMRRNDSALVSARTYSDNEIDAVTGLPDSRQAMDALTAAWDQREDFQAAVFAVRRLDMINARYGFRAGDEVLRVSSDHVAGLFGEHSLLFRWRGPFLFALIDKRSEASRVVQELQRLASTRLQHTLAVKDREVMLSISMVWTLVALDAKNIEEMVRTLDDLTTMQLRQAA
jgi:GGDEF domain-containing protein